MTLATVFKHNIPPEGTDLKEALSKAQSKKEPYLSPKQSGLHDTPTTRENNYVGNKTSAVGRNSSEWRQPCHDHTGMPSSNRRESMFYSPSTPRTYSENNYMTLSNNSRKRGPPMNKCDSDYDLPFKYPYEHEQGSRRFSHNI